MIERMELKGVHFAIDDNLRKYVTKKLGRMERYMTEHTGDSAHMEVTFKETKTKAGKLCHCDITLYLPHETIVIKESTINMYAAIDIVEAKLKMQLKKYKDLHDRSRLQRKLMSRLRSQEA